jgi:hypothetical protein
MLPTKWTILVELQLIGSISLVFCGRIITTLAFAASQSDYVSHDDIVPLKKKNPAPHLYKDAGAGHASPVW